MDTGNSRYPRDDIRVSDADRDQAVTELSEHFQSGRITQDEFDERSGLALQARTGADLSALFTDLPPRTALAGAASRGRPRAGQLRHPARGPPLPAGPRHRRPRHPLHRHQQCRQRRRTPSLGWLIPVVILALVFLRMGHRRR